jgi:hypothetical protein
MGRASIAPLATIRRFVLHLEVADVEQALAFLSSPGFKAAQAQAGVSQVTLFVATPVW